MTGERSFRGPGRRGRPAIDRDPWPDMPPPCRTWRGRPGRRNLRPPRWHTFSRPLTSRAAIRLYTDCSRLGLSRSRPFPANELLVDQFANWFGCDGFFLMPEDQEDSFGTLIAITAGTPSRVRRRPSMRAGMIRSGSSTFSPWAPAAAASLAKSTAGSR